VCVIIMQSKVTDWRDSERYDADDMIYRIIQGEKESSEDEEQVENHDDAWREARDKERLKMIEINKQNMQKLIKIAKTLADDDVDEKELTARLVIYNSELALPLHIKDVITIVKSMNQK